MGNPGASIRTKEKRGNRIRLKEPPGQVSHFCEGFGCPTGCARCWPKDAGTLPKVKRAPKKGGPPQRPTTLESGVTGHVTATNNIREWNDRACNCSVERIKDTIIPL